MEKQATPQLAVLNLRVLFGLLVALTGVLLALLSFGTFSAQASKTTALLPDPWTRWFLYFNKPSQTWFTV
jgi:hypothetical protein